MSLNHSREFHEVKEGPLRIENCFGQVLALMKHQDEHSKEIAQLWAAAPSLYKACILAYKLLKERGEDDPYVQQIRSAIDWADKV